MSHSQSQSKQFESLSDPTSGSLIDLSLQTSSPLSEQSPHTRGALAVHRRMLRRELLKSYVESQREVHYVEREQNQWYELLSHLHYERRMHIRECRDARRHANQMFVSQSKEVLQKLYGSSEMTNENSDDEKTLLASENEKSTPITEVKLNESSIAKINNQDVSLSKKSNIIFPPIHIPIGMFPNQFKNFIRE